MCSSFTIWVPNKSSNYAQLLASERVSVAVMLLSFILEMFASNLGRDICHVDCGSSRYSSVLASKSLNSTSNRPLPLPSKSFVYHPSIRRHIVELLKQSLNSPQMITITELLPPFKPGFTLKELGSFFVFRSRSWIDISRTQYRINNIIWVGWYC
jgi:hypothetical protein